MPPAPDAAPADERIVVQPAVRGNSQAPSIVNSSAEKPMAVLIGDTVRNPSASVIPLILHITQKPLSVIQEIGLLPAPMAMAK